MLLNIKTHLPFILFIQIFCCGCGVATKIGAATVGCAKVSINGLPSCKRSSEAFFGTASCGSAEKKSSWGGCVWEESVDADEELLKNGLAVCWDGGETFD